MRTGENIYKRKDGRWEARIPNGYNINGTMRYKSIYGHSYREVKDKLKTALKGNYASASSIRFDEVLKDFLEEQKLVVKESTLATYHELCQRHLLPFFRGMKLKVIDDERINSFIDLKLNAYSSKYVQNMVNLLQSFFKYAKRKQFLSRIDFDLTKFKVKTKEVIPFDDDEQKQLEMYLMTSPDRIKIACLLALFMGLRIGEICALTRKDIDLKNDYVYVRHTMERIKDLSTVAKAKTKIVILDPKTENAIRVVPIPLFVKKLLVELIDKDMKDTFILTGRMDKFIEPRLLEYHYKRILSKLKIEYRKFHTLRHTFATNSLRFQYFDLKTLQEILGHKDERTTLKNYVHSNLKIKREQMNNVHSHFISRQNYGIANSNSMYHQQETTVFQ